MPHRIRTLVALAVVSSFPAVLACETIADIRELTFSRTAPTTATDGGVDGHADAAVVDGAPDASLDGADGALGSWSIPSPEPPTSLSIDNDFLYWTTLANGSTGAKLLRMAKTGGPITVINNNMPNVAKVAIDGTSIFVTSGRNFDDGLLQRLDKSGDGGLVTLVANLSAPLGVTTDQDGVYWADLGDGGTTTLTGRIARTNKTGGGSSDVIKGLVLPSDVALDDEYVYFTTAGFSHCDGASAATGTVERIPKQPDAGTRTTYAVGQDCSTIVKVHDTRVFWLTTTTDRGTVSVVPKDGGDVVTLAKNQRLPVALETDGTRVYWLNGTAPDGTVLACVIADCANTLVTIASQQLTPYGLVLDSEYVYWANLGVPPVVGGTINRAAKPH